MLKNSISEDSTHHDTYVQHDDIPYLGNTVKSRKVANDSWYKNLKGKFHDELYVCNYGIMKTVECFEGWNTCHDSDIEIALFFEK